MNTLTSEPSIIAESPRTRLPRALVVVVLAVCVLPFCASLFGVDFSSPRAAIDPEVLAGKSSAEVVEILIHTLSGSYTHTILEWSAVCAAIFTAILAWVHFSIRKRDITTPVIGAALFCAGCMDAFHTLAANRLIEAAADNTNLIPFTWALCRLFNALIMIVGGLAGFPADECEEQFTHRIRMRDERPLRSIGVHHDSYLCDEQSPAHDYVP